MAEETPVDLLADITRSLKEQGINLDDEVSFDDDPTPPPAQPDKPTEAAPVQPEAAVVPPAEPSGQPVAAPEAPAVAPAAAAPAANDGGLYDYIRQEYGESIAQQLQGKYRSDTELVKGLINAYHLVGQRDDDAAFGRQLKPYAQELVQYIADKTRGKAAQPEPQKPSAPKFDPSWRSKIQVSADEAGKEVLTGDPEAIKQYSAWREHSQGQLESFLQDPENFLAPIVEKKAKEIAEAKLQEHTVRTADQEFAHNFIRSTKDWMFEGGQYAIQGGQLRGNLTPMGRLFTEKMHEATTLGIAKAEDQVKYATTAVYAEAQFQSLQHQQPPRAAPTAPAPVAAPVLGSRPNAAAAVYTPNTVAPDVDDCQIMEGESLAAAIARNMKKHNVKF